MREFELIKPTERDLRLDALSGRTRDYILTGDLIRSAPTRQMKEALRMMQFYLFKKLLPEDLESLCEFNKWQTEVIKNGSRTG